MGRALRLLLGTFALAAAIGACSLTDTSGLAGAPIGDDASADSADVQDGGRSDAAVRADSSNDSGVDAAPCTRRALGKFCSGNDDCCSTNCYGGECESRSIGAGCREDSNCDSNKCFGGNCTGRNLGAGCYANAQCDSNNCYGGSCEGNGPGAGCSENANCTSGSCYAARCQ